MKSMAEQQFELLGGALCLDFTNTIHDYAATDPREELHAYADLIRFGLQAGAINDRDSRSLLKHAAKQSTQAGKSLSAARAFRLVLYRIFANVAGGKHPAGRDLDFLNHEVAQIYGNLRVQNKGDDVQWTWKEDHQNLERVMWQIVRSAAELLTSKERELIRECGSKTCTWLFLDKSKNRTRRWCDMKKCGNRAKWRRHYDKIHHKDTKATKRILVPTRNAL
jgi:predicted RNA-binding Zn ribbon-like protein